MWGLGQRKRCEECLRQGGGLESGLTRCLTRAGSSQGHLGSSPYQLGSQSHFLGGIS